MHIKTYTSPAGCALAELCRQKQSSGIHQLMKEKDGTWRVNANALHKAMRDVGIELPQPTITRLLGGKESKQATIKALADFFGVDQAAVRGESNTIVTKIPSDKGTWPSKALLARYYALRPALRVLAAAAFESKITDLEDGVVQQGASHSVNSDGNDHAQHAVPVMESREIHRGRSRSASFRKRT
jgi:hypothetical protein